MAKREYAWMPTKEGGSKTTVKTRNDGTQGWLIQPLVIDGTTYFQLQHCAGNPDYAPSGKWTLMTRRHGIKSNAKRTAQPLNASLGQGCTDYILEKHYRGFAGQALAFETIVDAQTFAEETREFSMTTVCI
jgi:hypothetical protein|tara:strand:- start:484 stop:876 length:393 start_codon:yes stop_codon:yes gene_type:complete